MVHHDRAHALCCDRKLNRVPAPRVGEGTLATERLLSWVLGIAAVVQRVRNAYHVSMKLPPVFSLLREAVALWIARDAFQHAGALAFGATTVFAQVHSSLNHFWGVIAKPTRSGIVVFVTS
jgi:hypothetical protein